MVDQTFIEAKRAEVARLETVARETLAANPYSELTDKEVEAEWRELAHAERSLRPLLEALERADDGQPNYKIYRNGFDFRLTEAMTTIGSLCAYGRLYSLRQQSNGRKNTPREPDYLDKVILLQLGKGRRTSDIWEYIVAIIDETDWLDGNQEEIVVMEDGCSNRVIKRSSFDTVVSRLRKTLKK
jgi:hypothetical protein